MNLTAYELTRILNKLPGLYLILRPDHPKFTIVEVTDAYAKQTMTNRNEIIGKGLFEVFPDNPNDLEASGESNLFASLMRAIEHKIPDVMAIQKYDIQKPNGGEFEDRYWTPKNTPVLDETGNVLFLIHQVEDVTDWIKLRKSGEEMDAKLIEHSKELGKAHAELKEANRRKDIFLATLAHELRNPLAPIRSGVELLKMDIDQEEVIPTMERQINHLTHLIDDLTDSSRISRGKLKLRPEEVELSSNLKKIFQAIKQTPSVEHNLALELPSSPIYLKVDPTRFSQVVTNLINNSMKFTPKGGKIKVIAHVKDEKAVVTVKDEGIGVEKDHLASIFEMFVQADRPGQQQGLGLGLAIARMLIEMHGGKIFAKSEGKGKGLEVIIELPTIQPSARPAEDKTLTESIDHSGIKILVVDDNKDAAIMLSKKLQAKGYKVEVANDGEQGVKTAKEVSPDIILMDLGMPKMDGHEAAKQILSTSWGRDIPIIALSGWGQETDRDQTAQIGFKAHLVKPVAIEKLQNQINRELRDEGGL
ncbi:MAG: hypothetical protein CME64_08470 [Halobacteriovoraceae bacterium]|nr:hypothetical protein [Halobacteriovoraceae bacterium]